MTKEEIIRNLKYTMKKHENDNVPTFGTNISVMCKDILDYLEQEPCKDAISRQAVLNTLNKMDSVLDEDRTVETYKELPIACYNDLPPVTQTRKAEEIVICKNCKHCKKRYDGTGRQMIYMCEDDHCNDGTVGCEMIVEPNFFCAYGEREA